MSVHLTVEHELDDREAAQHSPSLEAMTHPAAFAYAYASLFGAELKRWRKLRGMSQFDLAMSADSTQRHISFLETGRSRPKAETVTRLSRVLDLSAREENHFLQLAGLSPRLTTPDLRHVDNAPFLAAVERMLEAQRPYPALVLNDCWDVVRLNEPAVRLMNVLGVKADNMAVAIFESAGMRDGLKNWSEIASSTANRLRREATQAPSNPRLQELLLLAMRSLEAARAANGPALETSEDRLVCPNFLVNGEEIRTFSMISSFQATHDETLESLRLESIFPRDDTSAAKLLEILS